MAARLAPNNVRRMHQSLHHLIADAPWSDEAVLDRCLDFVLPAMLRQEPVVAWVVDDTGFPKKGRESVGVARQYCGQVGKQDNCRVAVSLSVTTEKASMPVAFRLYMPRYGPGQTKAKKTGVPKEIQFQTKPNIALSRSTCPQKGFPRCSAGRRRIWKRHQFSSGDRDGSPICDGRAKHGKRLETRRSACPHYREQHRPSTQTLAARLQAPAGLRQRTGCLTVY